MNTKKFWLSNIGLLIAAFAIMMSPVQRAFADTTPATSPVGLWKSIDDTTHQPRSIIKIWEEKGQLYGKIVKIFFKEGESEKDLCTKCEGEDKNKPILGLTILRGFTEEKPSLWTGGTILDPESGKVYQSKLTLKDEGKTLDVRGFIGISLIGRTQTWERTTEMK